MNLLDKVTKYAHGARVLLDWLGGGPETVEQHTAQNRANICRSCPMNKFGVEIAESVAYAIKEQVELKNHLDLRVEGEEALQTCSACACPLKLKVWLPLSRITKYETPDSLAQFHEDCWIRRGV